MLIIVRENENSIDNENQNSEEICTKKSSKFMEDCDEDALLKQQDFQQMVLDCRSNVSLWDVFPAFWYNIQIIGHVLRLFLISHENVKNQILQIWNVGESDEDENKIAWRVGRVSSYF